MARRLTAASSQYFRTTLSAPVAGLPVTISAYFKPASATTSVVLCLGDSFGSSNLIELYYDAGNGFFRMYDGGVQPSTPSGVTAGTWYHVAGRAANIAATGVSAAKDGVFGAADSGVPQTVNIVYLGAQLFGGGVSTFCDGSLAEVGLWNVSLSDDEVAVLALGYSPLFVRPRNLVAYWPLLGRATDEEDWVGGYPLVNVNGSTVVDHPPIIYPEQGRMIVVPSASAAATPYSRGRVVNRGGVGSGYLRSHVVN